MYTPRREQITILDSAMEHINSVPYVVSARWLFYRLLQDSFYHEKGDYHSRFLPLTSKVRKNFYGLWRPDTLADIEDEEENVTQEFQVKFRKFIREWD